MSSKGTTAELETESVTLTLDGNVVEEIKEMEHDTGEGDDEDTAGSRVEKGRSEVERQTEVSFCRK